MYVYHFYSDLSCLYTLNKKNYIVYDAMLLVY